MAVDATRLVSVAFGLVMVAAAALQADGPALVAAGIAVTAVVVGVRFRVVATLAVLGTAAVIALSDPSPLSAALSGLSAVAYLLLRHGATFTRPTVVGALGFAAVGLAATAIPLQLAWVPLVAPVAVPALYLLVVWPFHDRGV